MPKLQKKEKMLPYFFHDMHSMRKISHLFLKRPFFPFPADWGREGSGHSWWALDRRRASRPAKISILQVSFMFGRIYNGQCFLSSVSFSCNWHPCSRDCSSLLAKIHWQQTSVAVKQTSLRFEILKHWTSNLRVWGARVFRPAEGNLSVNMAFKRYPVGKKRLVSLVLRKTSVFVVDAGSTDHHTVSFTLGCFPPFLMQKVAWELEAQIQKVQLLFFVHGSMKIHLFSFLAERNVWFWALLFQVQWSMVPPLDLALEVWFKWLTSMKKERLLLKPWRFNSNCSPKHPLAHCIGSLINVVNK